eukprot:s6502_g1.t1
MQAPTEADFGDLKRLARLDLPVLWFDFHLVLLQNPFRWLPKVVEGRLEMPSYREPCQRYCVAQGEPDIYLADEFYAPHLVKPTLMFLRPTDTTKRWLHDFLHWLWPAVYGLSGSLGHHPIRLHDAIQGGSAYDQAW